MPLFLPVFLLIGAEIWMLIEVGSRLGAGATLLLLAFAAVAGGMLIRDEGFTAARRINAAAAAGESPAAEMMASFARLLAGLLLIFPGFLTDFLALALLVPAVRRWMANALFSGVKRSATHGPATGPQDVPPGRSGAGRVIEGESNRLGD